MSGAFDPAKYLINLRGKGEYLEVKHRLLWLRAEHPEAVIETDLVRLDLEHDNGVSRDGERAPRGLALFKARVSIPGGGSATGYAAETADDFADYLEKCESKALGRALAALGYGTQFVPDHEFGTDGERVRVVDSPEDRSRRGQANRGRPAEIAERGAGQGATERQLKYVRAIAREVGLEDAELETWSAELYGAAVDQLGRRDASALIESLRRRKNETG